ncbi:MAG: leucine--tRNA ligase [Deltaproteobacteria bacterium]|nr:leucine--tRNA ligase [Deltaproteobacteria bacterium]
MTEYNHSEIEKKWQNFWEENKTYKVDVPGEKKLFCMDMFPYPSGDGLHIGHPLGYTATDIYCRYKRMQGFSVLHPMGFDAFGLPTEQHAVKVGEHPAVIAERNCEVFRKQLKSLGYCFDWDREVVTCDPKYYKWTQWIFLQLYNAWFDEEQQKARPIEELTIPDDVQAKGEKALEDYRAEFRLAYYTESMVNWCPGLGSVLANEEVINGLSERGGHPVFKKPMKQWMLRITKYAERLLTELESLDWPENIKEQQRNWIGKRFGTEIDFKVHKHDEVLTAFTTRPDTLFGVTFFVLSPEHPLVGKITTKECKPKIDAYCQNALKMSELDRTIENRKKTGEFTGAYVVNPINDELVPIYIGDYVLMSYGTGAVMGVPAHDERDFEFARTYQIEIRPVISPNDDVDPDVIRATCEGEIAYTEPGFMLPQEFAIFNELGLEGKPNEEAKKAINDWLERNGDGKTVINYKLRDWLFSRQRYWGEPIPIVHWEDGRITALSVDELPLVLPPLDDFKPSESGESPLAKAEDWLWVTDPKTGQKGRRETNTMPNWAGSCWYYLRYLDPENDTVGWNKEAESKWMPVDLYVGGAEHAVLHLLYSRFWHKVLYDLGHVTTLEPFQRLINQGMILAHAYRNKRGALVAVDLVNETPDGKATHKETGEELEKISAKMSKSLKNVVNPDDIVKTYGADTLRLHMMFMGPLEGTRMWDSQAIVGVNRFLKKAWKFVIDDTESGHRAVVNESDEPESVRRELHKAIKKVTEELEQVQLNTPLASMMEFLNAAGNESVTKDTLSSFVRVLAPYAPHLAEELWSRLGNSTSVTQATWPEFDEALVQDQSVTVAIQVNGKKRATVDVAPEIGEDELKTAIVEQMKLTQYDVSTDDRFITVFHRGTSVPRLVNVIQKK